MTSHRYLMVNAVRPNPEREDDYNRWHNNHTAMIFHYPGIKRINRYHLFKPLDPAGPPYMTVYECESQEMLDGLFKSPQMMQAKGDFETNWAGLGEVIWAGNFEPVQTLERNIPGGQENKLYTEIIAAGPGPGREQAYLDDCTAYLTGIFENKSIRRISHNKMMPSVFGPEPKCPPYLTVIEFISYAAMEGFYANPVFNAAGERGKTGLPAMDLQWRAVFECIRSLER